MLSQMSLNKLEKEKYYLWCSWIDQIYLDEYMTTCRQHIYFRVGYIVGHKPVCNSI